MGKQALLHQLQSLRYYSFCSILSRQPSPLDLRWLLRSLLKVGPGNFSNIQSFPRIKSSTSKKEYITPLVNYSYRGIRGTRNRFGTPTLFLFKRNRVVLPKKFLKKIFQKWYLNQERKNKIP